MAHGGYPWPTGKDVQQTCVRLITLTHLAREHGFYLDIQEEWPYWVEITDQEEGGVDHLTYCSLEEVTEKDIDQLGEYLAYLKGEGRPR